MTKTNLNVKLPVDVREALEQRAAERGYTVSAYVRFKLTEMVNSVPAVNQ